MQNVGNTPSIKSALQKMSFLFPVGVSKITITIQKEETGAVAILGDGIQVLKNPLAHGGHPPTIREIGIVQELRAYLDKNRGIDQYDDLDEILSRHAKVEEPLAVVADRKGYYIGLITKSGHLPWYIQVRSKGFDSGSNFEAPTYAEAEAKAREFLNTLTDKEII